MSTIYVPSRKAQVEAYRQQAKHVFKDKYETRTAPFRSIMVKFCRSFPDKDPFEAADEFCNHLRARGKWTAVVQATLMAATLDAKERGMLDYAKSSGLIVTE